MNKSFSDVPIKNIEFAASFARTLSLRAFIPSKKTDFNSGRMYDKRYCKNTNKSSLNGRITPWQYIELVGSSWPHLIKTHSTLIVYSSSSENLVVDSSLTSHLIEEKVV